MVILLKDTHFNTENKEPTSDEWYYTLFRKNAQLYLPMLEESEKNMEQEYRNLLRIFDELSVPPGGRILDLFCGIGRFSKRLAKEGYEVVGYDPSPLFVSIARRASGESLRDNLRLRFYEGAPYKVAENLLTNSERAFDVILVMSNSFGYGKEKDDRDLLSNLTRLASNQCIIVLEVENRDRTLNNFQYSFRHEFERLEIHQAWQFDFETSIASGLCRFYGRDTSRGALRLLLELTMKLRLYALHEIINMLASAGWKYTKCYGSLKKLEPFSTELTADGSMDFVTVGVNDSS
jgi:SAM-dependent methyltransferase